MKVLIYGGLFVIFIAVLVHFAPEQPADTSIRVVTDNPSATVKKLFTHDGCSGYEARGHFNTMYYVVCENKYVETKWTTQKLVGKITKNEDHTIQTLSQ